ncbi:hypothetical protein [Pectobacterium carotovorum]|uniref:hypothetical protein n=1 Tax=Pectobacterium carotovorum TaxID=554 RepID=UPI00382E39AA
MEKITLEVPNSPNISFTGQIVAQDSERGATTKIYETQEGKWIAAMINDAKGLLVQCKIIENKSIDELIKLFGYSDAAKRIYKQLNIDTTKYLDS